MACFVDMEMLGLATFSSKKINLQRIQSNLIISSFTYPLWSLRGDFKMTYHFYTGSIKEQLTKHRITPRR